VAEYEGRVEGAGRRFVLLVSRFNELITHRLLEGANACLLQHGVQDHEVDVVRVPGAFELPAAAAALCRTGRYHGIVALGCVIRGETPHFDYVAGEAARGLRELASSRGIAIGFGVLTTDDAEQAEARAGGNHGNKGWEAALTTLEMADLLARLEASAGP
jgi:6,7-dimethyl-8-ribityllumazine synthase